MAWSKGLEANPPWGADLAAGCEPRTWSSGDKTQLSTGLAKRACQRPCPTTPTCPSQGPPALPQTCPEGQTVSEGTSEIREPNSSLHRWETEARERRGRR